MSYFRAEAVVFQASQCQFVASDAVDATLLLLAREAATAASQQFVQPLDVFTVCIYPYSTLYRPAFALLVVLVILTPTVGVQVAGADDMSFERCKVLQVLVVCGGKVQPADSCRGVHFFSHVCTKSVGTTSCQGFKRLTPSGCFHLPTRVPTL